MACIVGTDPIEMALALQNVRVQPVFWGTKMDRGTGPAPHHLSPAEKHPSFHLRACIDLDMPRGIPFFSPRLFDTAIVDIAATKAI
jgi:hypothetical protein